MLTYSTFYTSAASKNSMANAFVHDIKMYICGDYFCYNIIMHTQLYYIELADPTDVVLPTVI